MFCLGFINPLNCIVLVVLPKDFAIVPNGNDVNTQNLVQWGIINR